MQSSRILYIDSKQIKKRDVIWGLLELGYDVNISLNVVDLFNITEEEVAGIMSDMMKYDIAFTQNFSYTVAEACHRLNKPYVSWVYDSPQLALFRDEAFYETNFIFMFDRYGLDIIKKLGVKNIYHMPLAANIAQTSKLEISDEDVRKFSSDVSFVGNLYQKDYMNSLLLYAPIEIKTELNEYINSRLCKWKDNSLNELGFSKQVTDYFQKYLNEESFKDHLIDTAFFLEYVIGAPLLTTLERKTLLNASASKYDTRLYTGKGDVSEVRANIFPKVDYETEMYKVFYSSKINLNITYKGIKTGLPQRIFDIMAVGGFVFTNYQEEVEEFFEIGKEIEVYRDEEEFMDKIAYYLAHENERLKIAVNGYLKVKSCYTYPILLKKMFDIVDRDYYRG